MALNTLSRSALRSKKLPFASLRCMTASPWTNFEMAPLDPIIGLNEAFAQDDYPNKVIVGVGAYRDDQGKPFVLSSVRKAEKLLVERGLDMEYAGIAGEPKFVDLAMKFV
jgi:aspartate aminotransferase